MVQKSFRIVATIVWCLCLSVTPCWSQPQVYKGKDKRDLLIELLVNKFGPDAFEIFGSSTESYRSAGYELADVANSFAGCQAGMIDESSTLTDVQIIHLIWEQSRNANVGKRKATRVYGESAVHRAIGIFAGASYDCLQLVQKMFPL